jgi:hypothetical protein
MQITGVLSTLKFNAIFLLYDLVIVLIIIIINLGYVLLWIKIDYQTSNFYYLNFILTIIHMFSIIKSF